MLDFNLARLYDVETRILNQAIKRNLDSFPDDFMFRLTISEWTEISSSSQFVMMEKLPKNRTGRYLPYAFTEHGVTMLASVLKSATARKMNIAIVRAFIAMRKFAVQYSELTNQLNDLRDQVGNHDTQLNDIYKAIESLLAEKAESKLWEKRDKIGFIKEEKTVVDKNLEN